MEKRLLVAMAISLLILFAFQKFHKTPAPFVPAVPVGKVAPRAIAGIPAEPAEVKEEPREEEETVIQTDRLTIVFSDIGGAVKSISLRGFVDAEKREQLLCEGDGVFSTTSALFPGMEKKRYKMSRGKDFLEYKLIEPGQIEITKRYNFYKPFNHMDLCITVKNLSSKDVNFSYDVNGPFGLEQIDKVMGRSFLEADALIGDKIWRKKAVKGAQEIAGDVKWTALTNRYFTLALKPFSPPRSMVFKELAPKKISTAIKNQAVVLSPREKVENNYLIYAGPLDEKRLAEIGYGMEGLVNYGIFGGISKFLLSTLRFFHRITKNWGVAIILLTLLINGVLFPLTKKSVTSMHQMKRVQPHMQKLKELHKDNPQKLNKEMMELYKKYNVNPLSGCLPLLLQMPVFISLYQGLIRSIELKGAHFLWIKDLSRPDAVPLPVSLPFIGASINILPLIMIGMMVVQQKTSQGGSAAVTDEQASQQKMMLIVFPVVFGFLFYNMPAGLVLYWLTNTILMTTEQKMLGRSMDRE
ncbi:MAG: membrane protein insertase YidC [Candidatus Omnitrophota bacterium]